MYKQYTEPKCLYRAYTGYRNSIPQQYVQYIK